MHLSDGNELVKDCISAFKHDFHLPRTLPFGFQFLSCAYAEHLMEQQQAEQAGLLLWRCGEPVRALQAFTSSSSWRNAICVAQQIPLPPDQLSLLARDLAGNHDNRQSD